MTTDGAPVRADGEHPDIGVVTRRWGELPHGVIFAQSAETFAMLAAESRLRLLWLLTSRGEMNVTALAEATHSSTQSVSQHLSKMRMTGLVSARRDGRTQYYRVDDPHISSLVLSALDHHEDLHDRKINPPQNPQPL